MIVLSSICWPYRPYTHRNTFKVIFGTNRFFPRTLRGSFMEGRKHVGSAGVANTCSNIYLNVYSHRETENRQKIHKGN